MSRVLTNEQNYYDIANTIRQMKNVNTTYKPREMASALKDIYSNEVEGTLPLSFEANGNNLLNYRIDGNTGGVGDRTKNILINNLETQTYKGITLTVNADKSVTLNGTATESINFVTYSNSHTLYPNDYQHLENGIYIVSGTPIDAEVNSYYMSFRYAKIGGSSSLTRVPPNGVQIDNSTGNYELIALYITVWSGVTVNNVIFKPMICNSNETLEYEQPGYKIPVIAAGKNLFDKNNAEIVRLYPKGDGGMNGMATSDSISWSLVVKVKPNTHYCFSMNSPTGNNYNNCLNIGGYSNYPTDGMAATIFDTSSTRDGDYVYNTFTTNSNTNYLLIFLWSNASYTESVVRNIIDIAELQLEYGDERTEYESYTSKTSTIIIDQPLEDDESISLSDTNTNISTFDGINTLTIGTTVQPSNVYIQAPKDSIEAIQIANRLEEI